MRRALTLAAFLMTGIHTEANADAYDCFPMCPPAAAEQAPAKKLCDVGVVREAAHVNEQLRPAKEIYAIATNPTGYVVKLVDEHVVHIPKWVGYAMDPKGAIKGEVMKRVRDEAKKRVGLENDCAAPAPGEAADEQPAEAAADEVLED